MERISAAILAGPREVLIQEVEMPSVAPGEVRIRLEGCGVCGSNLEPWEGQPWSTYPGEPGGLGHEGWGRIDAVGEGVTALAVGDRVAALSHHSFAEYDVASADRVVPLPPSLHGQPFPGEALGCAMNIFKRSDIRAGQTVAIIGIGFLGAILSQLAADAGARVIAISRRAFSLDIARRFGAAETITMDDHYSIIERVSALTRGSMCERVIEAVGKQWPLDLASELVGIGGRLVIAGYHQDGPRQVNVQQWNWKGIDVINAHERDPDVCLAGLHAAIDAVASGRLDPSPLYTHSYRLAQLNDALVALGERPDGFLKALVTYE